MVRTSGPGGPCYGCEERYLACHDDCEKYREWADNRQLALDARKEYKRLLELQYSGFARARKEHFRKIRY
jgi:hypothetical protein